MAAAPVAAAREVREPRIPAKPFTYALPADAGIQMMETKSTANNAAAAVSDEPVKRGRARPPRAKVAEEPMQIVETGGTPPQ
jgi:hypothetical protein